MQDNPSRVSVDEIDRFDVATEKIDKNICVEKD
jgi:hypothetical protein